MVQAPPGATVTPVQLSEPTAYWALFGPVTVGGTPGRVGSVPPTNSGSTPLLVTVTVLDTGVPTGTLPKPRLPGSTAAAGPLITLPNTVNRSVRTVFTPGPPTFGPSTWKKLFPVGLPATLCGVALSPTY